MVYKIHALIPAQLAVEFTHPSYFYLLPGRPKIEFWKRGPDDNPLTTKKWYFEVKIFWLFWRWTLFIHYGSKRHAREDN